MRKGPFVSLAATLVVTILVTGSAQPAPAAGDKAALLRGGTCTAGNAFYQVHVQDNVGCFACGIGLYTITTGPSHPAGSGLNVLFGDGSPFTSFNTIRSYSNNTDYVQISPTVFGAVWLNPFGTASFIGTTGCRTTYVLPGPPTTPDALTIIQDVNVNGTTFEDSTVEVTTRVTNNGSSSVAIGIRYLWDFQIGQDDGPTFQAIGPNGTPLITEAGFLGPAFTAYRIEDNDGPNPPIFNVLGTVTGPATVVPRPTAPDLLQYVCWASFSPAPGVIRAGAFDTVFEYPVDENRIIATADASTNTSCSSFSGGDVAVLYFFGHDSANAITIPGGGMHTVSASLFLTAPAVGAEVCGNGIDDNLNGLIDSQDPECASASSSALILTKGKLRLERDRDEDEDEDDEAEHEDKLFLRGSFVADLASLNPPAQGVTVTLTDGDGRIVEISIPPGEGWKTKVPGREWSFKDKKDRHLADRQAREKLRIKCNAQGQCDLRVEVKDTELTDPDAGLITTTLTIGGQTFVNTQNWRSKDRGKKLVTP